MTIEKTRTFREDLKIEGLEKSVAFNNHSHIAASFNITEDGEGERFNRFVGRSFKNNSSVVDLFKRRDESFGETVARKFDG